MEVMAALKPSAWKETGNKMRSFSYRPCCASAKVMVKCCRMLTTRHLPSLLLFDLTQLVFSHWPLTWHSTVDNHDLISILNIYLRVMSIEYCGYGIHVMVSTKLPCKLHIFHCVYSLQHLPIILPSGCCPTTTCTSVFDDTFKLSSR